jgi:ribonuclease HI
VPNKLPPRILDLKGLVRVLHIDKWDAIMIGDGSGTRIDNACGWATWIHMRHKAEPQVVFGGFSHGTNNVAEIMAYLQGMLWYERTIAKRDGVARNVHIVTDGEYVAQCGGNQQKQKKNSSLWRAFDVYQREGIVLHWHWMPKNSSVANMEADALSRNARVCIEHTAAQYDPS